ncbi:hypothetical protein LQ948_08300 [Jiella sp. MQZ9-1]|uniref:Uncharacterized protein n=1 Tax=Jiella flava TaxID=2816857 RepID=A0A939FZC6_9HYPH|nr:hypothetical protein [Jiella flava]MBO0662788.1 hypothetical protein [Jiella flava]MCD2471209.1 hypothetical protein [Jiella flava]
MSTLETALLMAIIPASALVLAAVAWRDARRVAIRAKVRRRVDTRRAR